MYSNRDFSEIDERILSNQALTSHCSLFIFHFQFLGGTDMKISATFHTLLTDLHFYLVFSVQIEDMNNFPNTIHSILNLLQKS